VRKEVSTRCTLLSQGGGYVFNTIHNIQAETPIANIAAMVESVRKFNQERGF